MTKTITAPASSSSQFSQQDGQPTVTNSTDVRDDQPAALSGVSAPSIWVRPGKRSKFPFGSLLVGQSIVVRAVNRETLDRAIDSWRKRKNIDLGRIPVVGDFVDEHLVFRRG